MSLKQPARFWWFGNGLLACVWVFGLVVLADSMLRQPVRYWSGEPQVTVQLKDNYFRLQPDQAQRLMQYSAHLLTEKQAVYHDQLAALISVQLDELFYGVEQKIPDFVDWNYSLGAETGRFVFWVGKQLQWTDGDYMARRATDILFGGADWDKRLDRLAQATQMYWAATQHVWRDEWEAALLAELAPYRIPAPIGSGAEALGYGTSMSLHAFGELGDDAALRVALGGGAGLAASAAVWRQVGMRSAAGRVAGRGASRAGAAAASGGVMCSPGGPAALGCAVVVGLATWIATDWALLKVDKAMTRDALEQGIRLSVAELQSEMQANLIAHYSAELMRYQGGLQTRIEHTFIPVNQINLR